MKRQSNLILRRIGADWGEQEEGWPERETSPPLVHIRSKRRRPPRWVEEDGEAEQGGGGGGWEARMYTCRAAVVLSQGVNDAACVQQAYKGAVGAELVCVAGAVSANDVKELSKTKKIFMTQ